MKKSSFSAIIFFIASLLFAETVMVETVDFAELGDLDEEKQNMIIQMETGVMDALFDGGHLFFNMYTVNGSLDPDLGQKSLVQAGKAGASWFVRLLIGDNRLSWWFYRLSDFSLMGEGAVLREDVDKNEEMTLEEFYFEAGKTAGSRVLTYMNR